MADKKSIIVHLKEPNNFVVFRPIYEILKKDHRLSLSFSGKLFFRKPEEYARLLGLPEEADKTVVRRELLKQIGLENPRLVNPLIVRWKRFDLLISPVFQVLASRARVKVQIFHGDYYRNYSACSKSLKFDKLFFFGSYYKRQFIKRQKLSDNDQKAEVIGYPKLDCLVDGSLDAQALKEKLSLDPRLPTVLYAPHSHRLASLELHGHEVIKALAELPINFLIKLHDASYKIIKKTDWHRALQHYQNLYSNLRVIRDFNITPYHFISDVVVSDASGAAYEFLVLDRPIIFYDVPERIKMLRLKDMDTWGRKMGRVVKSPEELKEAVLEALDHPELYREVRQKAAQDLYFEPGSAAQRAAEKIYQLLDLEPPKGLRGGDTSSMGRNKGQVVERYATEEAAEKYALRKPYRKDTWSVRHIAEVMALRKALAHEKDPILEIAIGTGRIAREVMGNGRSYIGLDTSLPMLQEAHREISQQGNKTLLIKGDAFLLPFREKSFGAVICFRLLRHFLSLSDRRAVYSEAQRVLRKGGLFLMDAKLKNHSSIKPWKLSTYKYYTLEEARDEIEESGFEVVKIYGKLFGLEHLVPRFLREVKPIALAQSWLDVNILSEYPFLLKRCPSAVMVARKKGETC